MTKKKILFLTFDLISLAPNLLSAQVKDKYEVYKLTFLDHGWLNRAYPTLNCNDLNISEIVNFCGSFDYVVISSMSINKEEVFLISDNIRKKTSTKVIVGGPLGIYERENTGKHCDVVCYWEGDNLIEVLDFLDLKSKQKTVPNFWLTKEKFEFNVKSVDNLDKLPFQNIFYENEFIYLNKKIIKQKKKFNIYGVESARGCLFSCTYCSNCYLNKVKARNNIKIIRKKSMSRVIEEIKALSTYADQIRISDDNFFFRDLEEIKFFVNKFNKIRNIQLVLDTDFRSHDYLSKMKEISKIKNLIVGTGIQSGSSRLRSEVFNRHIATNKILYLFNKTLKICRESKNNIELSYSFILGHPKEKLSDILKNLNFILKLRKGVGLSLNMYTNILQTDKTKKCSKHFYDTKSENFKKYSFYYFLHYLLNHLIYHRIDYFLPKQFNDSIFFKILNFRIFSGIYGFFVDMIYKSNQRALNKFVFDSLELNNSKG